jgi:elongation factor G
MSRDDDVLIDAMVPPAKMLGYANTLDMIASGRATYTMQFDHYVQVSPEHPDPLFRPAAMRLAFVRP